MPSQKTAEISIDGDTFVIRKFNMGELRKLTEAFEKKGTDKTLAFDVLQIAMERAKLKGSDTPVDFDKLEPDTDEIAAAFVAIMALTGMRAKVAGDPPKAGQETVPGPA